MKNYEIQSIRNIVLLGHQGTGKTTLTESILQVTGVIDKKGEVEKGTTVSDFTKEEKDRQISITTSLIPVEYNGYKYNFIDTPGYGDFLGEVYGALRVASGAVLVIDATKGVEVGTETAWRIIREQKIPAIIFINKMDKENIQFEKLLEDIQTNLGKRAVPFAWPIGRSENFEGFVNVVEMKARIYDGEKCVDAEIWEEKMDKVEQLNEAIKEAVAETDEALLEKYFEGEPFTPEEIQQGLRSGVLQGELTPIIVGSAIKNVGVHTLLDMIVQYLPTPAERAKTAGVNPKTGEAVERQPDPNAPFSALIFKTLIDPFLGQINYFLVQSGSIRRDQEIIIADEGKKIKMGQIYFMRGKEQIPTDVISAGDIGAVVKMTELATGMTICDPQAPIKYDPIEFPQATHFIGVKPKNKNDEEKLSDSLNRLRREDPVFVIQRNVETNQLLVGGLGQTHIDVILERIKNNYNVDIETEPAEVVYRETIKKTATARGRHKKQTGGAGQFGDVWIRFEPIKEGFEFAEEIFGGAVPKNFFPAVEKGLIEACEQGFLAGYPVIGIRCVLYDGSYHPVDSNEISFKLAAQLAFKEGLKNAEPTLLEPIMKLEVTVKDQYIGDVMGDLNKRRGRVLGMNPAKYEGWQTVEAYVPQAEVLNYTIDLKAMTQASGFFTMTFDHYEEVPQHLQQEIIQKAKEKRNKS
ncbi:MAG TPA: elongation factor G [Haloplasmataceae bacterium]